MIEPDLNDTPGPSRTTEPDEPSVDGAPSIASAIDRLTAELRHHRAGSPLAAATDLIEDPWNPVPGRPATALPQPAPDPLRTARPRTPFSRPGPVAIVIAALLAVAAQRALITGWTLFELEEPTRQRLSPTWQDPEPVLTAIVLVVLALAVLTVSGLYRGRLFPGARTLYRHLEPISVALIAGGGAIFGWLILTLNRGEYEPSYPRWYLLSLILILTGLFRRDRKLFSLRTWPHRLLRHTPEVLAVTALVGTFLWLAMHDIRSWRFVSIGDEHAFFDVALWFSDGRGPQNLFTNEGVYGYHPMLSSWIVAQVMGIVGHDVVGWRLGANVPVAIGLVFFYLLARVMFNRLVGLTALGLIVSSHYILAFAHIGYNNLEPILSSCAALFFFVLAMRRTSASLFIVSGLFAGLGWYTFYSGRITIGVIAVCTLLIVEKRHWILRGFQIGLGFALAVLPIVVVSGSQMYERMRIETLATPEGPPRSDLSRLLINTGRSLVAFNYSTVRAHYVTGSLAEPITGALFVVGILIALVSLRDWRSRLLLTWFAIGIAATGIASKYDFVPITRLHYVLPCVVLIAAAAAWYVVSAGAGYMPRHWRRWTVPLALALIVGGSTWLDLHRWYVTSPALAGSSHTSVIWRAMTSESCTGLGVDPLLVTFDGDGNIDWIVREHQPDFGVEHAHFAHPEDWIERANNRCVIFRNPDEPLAREKADRLMQRWPNLVMTPVTNLANGSLIHVYAPIPIDVD